MKKLFVVALTALSISSSVHAYDNNWYSRHLQATDGSKITVDFQYRPDCHKFSHQGRMDHRIRYARPVWFNVRAGTPYSQVRVEISFYSQSNRRFGSYPPAISKDHNYFDRVVVLAWAGEGRFTGQTDGLAIRHSIGSSYTDLNVLQKLRVTVDGRPLIDPISGSDQFTISLDDKRGCL